MPIIEYRCDQCQQHHERIFLSQNIDAVSVCPTCSSASTILMSVPAVVRIAGEGVFVPYGKKSERIQEPVWRDTKTGKVESMY